MSLLSEAMEECVIIDKTTQPDGYGGIQTVWTEGAPFSCAIVFDSSIEAKRAEAEGVKSLYTVITDKSILLPYATIFRRVSDDRLFRVTSDGTDKKTPMSAGLDMRVVSAEQLKALPNGESNG